MGMERVTIEQNGERFTIDVPEGTTDEQIKNFVSQQQQSTPSSLTTVEPSLSQPVEGMAEGAALRSAVYGLPNQSVTSAVGPIKPTTTVPPGPAVRAAGEVADLISDVSRVTPKGIAHNIGHPLQTLAGLPGALMDRFVSPATQSKSIAELAKGAGQAIINPTNIRNVGTSLGAMAMAPENAFAAPYQMAAYEQEKIRQNPTAPEYATNPYAQQYRGEYATQGAAGAANRRQAIAGQQYSGLTPEQQRMLEQDRIDQAIRRKAAEKVLGPIAP